MEQQRLFLAPGDVYGQDLETRLLGRKAPMNSMPGALKGQACGFLEKHHDSDIKLICIAAPLFGRCLLRTACFEFGQ